jgi:hypothetical protein
VAVIRRDEGFAMLPKKSAIAIAALAAAVSLAGCATWPAPGSPEEQIWFDKAVGYEIHKVPPSARIDGAIGYPHIDGGFYR